MESDLPPTSYSVSEELHIHSRPHTICYQYLCYNTLHLHCTGSWCACVYIDQKKKACHFPVSNLWLVDLESEVILTWPCEHFTSNSRAKSYGYKHTYIRTEISPPNSLVWGSLRLAPIIIHFQLTGYTSTLGKRRVFVEGTLLICNVQPPSHRN